MKTIVLLSILILSVFADVTYTCRIKSMKANGVEQEKKNYQESDVIVKTTWYKKPLYITLKAENVKFINNQSATEWVTSDVSTFTFEGKISKSTYVNSMLSLEKSTATPILTIKGKMKLVGYTAFDGINEKDFITTMQCFEK